MFFFFSVACVPQNLNANMSCSNNVASMSWNNSEGGQLYSVTAVSPDGLVDECSSSNNNCELSNLQCGQYYTATVTADDVRCQSKPSNSVTIKTGMSLPSTLPSFHKNNIIIITISKWSSNFCLKDQLQLYALKGL